VITSPVCMTPLNFFILSLGPGRSDMVEPPSFFIILSF